MLLETTPLTHNPIRSPSDLWLKIALVHLFIEHFTSQLLQPFLLLLCEVDKCILGSLTGRSEEALRIIIDVWLERELILMFLLLLLFGSCDLPLEFFLTLHAFLIEPLTVVKDLIGLHDGGILANVATMGAGTGGRPFLRGV